MSGSFLELMGATAGALALIDRLAENPKTRRRTLRGLPQTSPDRQAYKNYLLTFNAFNNRWYISRDNAHIGSADTLAAAKAIVDEIADNPKSRNRRMDGDVFVSWRDPITRKAREQRVTVIPQGIQLARRLVSEGARDVEVIEYNRGTEFVAWSPGMEHENPRGRSKGSITRRSQATKKPPSKRLIARRKKTLRAPAGFYANPIKCHFGIKVNAGNDVNGNPRRAVAFFVHDGKTASLLGVVQEQYAGMQGIFREINLDSATTPVIGEFNVSVSQFRDLLKMRPGIVY